MIVEGATSHSSKLKSIITLSIFETEYMAIFKARSEAVWLKYLLKKLVVREPGSIQLKADNQRLIMLASNHDFHYCPKHIDAQFH